MAAQPCLQQVVRVIADVSTYPTSHSAESRIMVANGLPDALPPVVAEHKDLVELSISMLTEVLKNASDSILNAKTRRQEAEDELVIASAAVEGKTTAKDQLIAASERASAAQLAKKDEVSAFEKVYKEEKKVEEEACKELTRHRSRNDEGEACRKALRCLEDETQPPSQEATDTVFQYLENSCVDKALLAAVPGALKCRPADRSGFDVVAHEAIRDAVNEHVATDETKLAEAAKNHTYVESEMLGSWAIADVAKDHQKKLRFDAYDLVQALKEAQSAEQAARDAVTSQEAAVKQAMSLVESTEKQENELKRTLEELQTLATATPAEEPIGTTVSEPMVDIAEEKDETAVSTSAEAIAVEKEQTDLVTISTSETIPMEKELPAEPVPMAGVVEALGA